MVKNFFITIHDTGDDSRASRSENARAARGHDPGRDFVQPPPDDPGRDFVQPPPDDPGRDFVMPPPDDPGRDFVMPPPDDPRVVGTVHAQPFAGFPVCCCGRQAEEASTTSTPSHDYSGFVIVRLAADVRPLSFETLYELASNEKNLLPGLKAVLEIELEEGAVEDEPPEDRQSPAGSRRRRKEWRRPAKWVGPLPSECKKPPDDERDPAATREPEGVLRSAPLIDVPGKDREATLEAMGALERLAHTTVFRPLHSLKSYWRVDLRPYPDRVEEVVEALQRLREVDAAYRELSAVDSQDESTSEPLSEDQGYLDPAPVGIGARWAWDRLTELVGKPTVEKKTSEDVRDRVRIVDLEQGWILGHYAFGSTLSAPFHGDNRAGDDPDHPDAPELGQHGTAVLGQLAATQMLTGSARNAELALASHYKGDNDGAYPFPHTNGHVAAAIVNALVGDENEPPVLERGDVLLLEVQRGGFPTEIDPADFDAIRLASALGVIVVEAAGNGSYDLDRVRDPVDGRGFRRGASNFVDSGAIFVGAARAEIPHDRASFSNFGSRVDCFAWGEGVTTAGYGDLMGDDVPVYYTNTFNGTSSAAPVIAGAAALVQSLHGAQARTPLRPRPMRALLSNPNTGTRQGPNVGGHIGIMPDLWQVIGGELHLVPRLYLRKRPGDEGAPTGPDDEISSSPDVLVWEGSLPDNAQDLQEAFGSSSRYAHDPAPGQALVPGSGRKVHVRLCNRGGGAATGWVHLFAGPAATLVTPERWSPVELDQSPPQNPLEVPAVLQGDTLTVSEGFEWESASGSQPLESFEVKGWPAPEELHSLLAVLVPEDAQDKPNWQILPPGPPYFQWNTYRAFLRRRGVAWRNAHRVEVGEKSVALVLACHVAGTPDRERRFDFEVIQRLPRDAKVILAAPSGFTAKLHQRQPWLQKEEDRLTLPQRRSTRFSRVNLAAHAFVPMWLRLEFGPDTLGWGHSLALRQLWDGEEVGRVTWHFGRS